jgi:hypothetical protein
VKPIPGLYTPGVVLCALNGLGLISILVMPLSAS